MAQPIAVAQGQAMAFPDICLTPSGPQMIPMPYPNIADLSAAQNLADDVTVAGVKVLIVGSTVDTSSGDEVGSGGGVKSGVTKGKCEITQGSTTVVWGPNSKGVARFMDPTSQNDGNAVGNVLALNPTVLVGG